jgi:hypothetical protein
LLQPFFLGCLWHVDHGFLGILISQALAYVAMGFYFSFLSLVSSPNVDVAPFWPSFRCCACHCCFVGFLTRDPSNVWRVLIGPFGRACRVLAHAGAVEQRLACSCRVKRWHCTGGRACRVLVRAGAVEQR